MNYHYSLRGFIAIILILVSITVNAKNYEDADIKTLVEQEVKRLLGSKEFSEKFFENGISRFIDNQQRSVQAEKAEKQKQRAKNIRPVDLKRDHIRGKVDAQITIIEYSDYECPFCKRFHPTMNTLYENNKDSLRWVYRHFPLGFHDPGATKQAEATECVAELGGNDAFWKYSDLIYKRTKSNGKGFPLENLKPLAEEVGVDAGKFEKCLNSGRYTNRVKEDIANGQKIGITGTPAAFILNKKGEMKFVGGAMPLERLQKMVDELKR